MSTIAVVILITIIFWFSLPLNLQLCAIFAHFFFLVVINFLVACYATLHPALSVGPSVRHTLLSRRLWFFFFALQLLPKCSTDLKYGPCPPTRDWGSRVTGLVFYLMFLFYVSSLYSLSLIFLLHVSSLALLCFFSLSLHHVVLFAFSVCFFSLHFLCVSSHCFFYASWTTLLCNQKYVSSLMFSSCFFSWF